MPNRKHHKHYETHFSTITFSLARAPTYQNGTGQARTKMEGLRAATPLPNRNLKKGKPRLGDVKRFT
jgi:hypothetical protein